MYTQKILNACKSIRISLLIVLLGNTLNAQNINIPNIDGPNGLEVNSRNGNLHYDRFDIEIRGVGLGILASFTYNSQNSEIDYGYGKGWMFPYAMQYQSDSTGIIISRMDGRLDTFTVEGESYKAPVGIFDFWEEYEPKKFVLTTKLGIQYFFEDDSHGKLTKIQDTREIPYLLITSIDTLTRSFYLMGENLILNGPMTI